MPFSDLKDFIDFLEQNNELVRVNEPVSTVLEMTEIQTRVIAEKGPAILFEKPVNPEGNISPIPVLVNVFGTINRVALALNRSSNELRSLGETLAFLKQPEPPDGWREAISMLPLLKSVMSMKPSHTSKKAPSQAKVITSENVNLFDLPIQTCWPNEPSPLITWPLVITKGIGESFNIGIYRMQVLNKNMTIMRWLKHRGGAQHYERWKKEFPKKPMPVAVVIGSDPATILAAATPTPERLSEYQFAGLLREKKIELTEAITIPVKVPANAEIILEGHILPNETADEGPFGDHTGYFNAVESFPVFKVSAITMREQPIYLSTYTGRPPDEPSIIGQALNEIFIPILQQQFPEIIDFWLPPEACSYRIAVVSIKKSYPGHAKTIMMGIWSYLKQFMYTKWIIVVDEDINVRDWKDVMWAVSTRMDPSRDTVLIENTPIDYLDFASIESNIGSKAGFDATTKFFPETKRTWGKEIFMTDHVVEIINSKWHKLGLPGSGKPIWKKNN